MKNNMLALMDAINLHCARKNFDLAISNDEPLSKYDLISHFANMLDCMAAVQLRTLQLASCDDEEAKKHFSDTVEKSVQYDDVEHEYKISHRH